ncbi:MAG: TetR/AcrR family transcriptional regulator [Mangrovibacterium sp.]
MVTKAERTRQFIIEKAAPIINRKGMAGTSMSDIMDATHVAKGCLYGNFENKEEICLEAFQFLVREFVGGAERQMKRHSSAKDKLFAFLDYFKDDRFRAENGGCPLLNFGVEADDTNPKMREEVRSAIEGTQSMLKRLIEKGIEAGEFKPDISPDVMAVKIHIMLEGASLVGRIQNRSDVFDMIVHAIKTELDHK